MRITARMTARPLLALFVPALLLAQSAASAQNRRVELPTGTVIPVTLNTPLSSKTSRPGDRFTATVKYGRDDAGLPEGTRVEGVVREAIPSGDGKPGVLDMDFRRIVTPGGASHSLDATLTSLDGKSVKRSSGRLVAKSDKSKDRLKWVGIGAGAGLVIAAITKQNTIFSTLLGAGAGYIFNELQNKKPGDVNLKAGTEFGVRLERQFAFNTRRAPYRASANERDALAREDDRYYHRSDAVQSGNTREADRARERDHAVDSSEEIGALLNDKDIRFGSAKPFRKGDTVMVPFDAVAKAANLDYRYDAVDRTIRVRNSDVRLALDSRVAIVNGERKRLAAAAEMRGGALYVPMQFLEMALNGSAYWDAPSRTVVITTQNRDHE